MYANLILKQIQPFARLFGTSEDLICKKAD